MDSDFSTKIQKQKISRERRKELKNRLKIIFSSSKNKVEDVTVYDLIDLGKMHNNSIYCFFYKFLSYFNRRNFINNLFGFVLLYGTIFFNWLYSFE